MPAEAAEIAVPFPLSTPVMVVDSVSAGVAPPDDEPAKPFVETTDTAVTVPVVGVAQVGATVVPPEVNTWPAEPLANLVPVPDAPP